MIGRWLRPNTLLIRLLNQWRALESSPAKLSSNRLLQNYAWKIRADCWRMFLEPLWLILLLKSQKDAKSRAYDTDAATRIYIVETGWNRLKRIVFQWPEFCPWGAGGRCTRPKRPPVPAGEILKAIPPCATFVRSVNVVLGPHSLSIRVQHYLCGSFGTETFVSPCIAQFAAPHFKTNIKQQNSRQDGSSGHDAFLHFCM